MIHPAVLILLLLVTFPAFAQVHLFTDDNDGRSGGAIEAGTDNLSIRILAEHPWIDPVQGWPHPRGLNRNTSYQLETLTRTEGRLRLLIYNEKGERVREGELGEVHRGNIHEHRRLPDGHFAYYQLVNTNRITSIELQGDPLPPGTYTGEIHAYGERRAQLSLASIKGQINILEVIPLLHGNDDATRPHFPDDFHFITEPGEAEEQKRPPPPRQPVDPTKWKALDIAEKWKTFESDAEENPGSVRDWATFLRAEKDEEFMEQLAIYRHNAFEELGLGGGLHAMDSDRWIRLCIWHYRAPGGHGMSVSYSLLTNTNTAPEVLSWLKKYPDQLKHPGIATLPGENSAFEAAKTSTALPPLNPSEIFKPWLAKQTPPSSQAEFDRSIDAFLVQGRFEEPLLDRFHQQVRGPHDDVLRWQSLLLGCSWLHGLRVPTDTLTAIVHDDTLDPRLREAALLGSKNMPATPGYALLHDVAFAPDHPAWSAAIVRLGDVGDGFSLQQLSKFELPPAAAAQCDISLQKIEDRLANRPVQRTAQVIDRMRGIHYRTLNAEARGSPYAADLRAWYLGQLKEAGPAIRKAYIERLENIDPATIAFPEGSDPEKLLNEIRKL